MTKVISFSSGKGGVGKTTLVANLGYLFAQRGKKTLLIDADWTLGKLGITLGVRPTFTIDNVLKGQVSLAQSVTRVSPGLSLIASPSGLVGFEELEPEARNQIFYEMEELQGQYDTILFDHSSGVSWSVLQFAAASHQHVIVTTPEPTSYTDAYAIMKLLSRRFGVRDFSLVVTMSQNSVESEGIIARFSDIARHHLNVRVNLIDIFPWDSKVSDSIRRQQPLAKLYPGIELTSRLEKACTALDAVELTGTHGLNFFYGNQHSSTR